MEFQAIAIVAGFVLLFALVSGRIETTPLTGPIVFVTAGVVLGPTLLDAIDVGIDEGGVRVLAELTLVLVLFTDAIRIDLGVLRSQFQLPSRLLGIGLPLTILAGTLLGLWLLPGLGVWEAALVATILTPTDAALGQAVITNQRVPVRVRQAINVESGLNDGLMLPLITIAVAFAATGVELETPAYWARFVAAKIGYGVLIGAAVGYVGGRLLDHFARRGWVKGAFRQLATLAIGIGAFASAELAGGNGFVGAFVAGLAFGAAARDHCDGAYEFAEDEGKLLVLLTFLFFGATLVGPALDQLTWQIAVYAIGSLTVVRMLPVAVSLVGFGLRPPTIAYIGWFGPRGLASILFGLFVATEAALPGIDHILLVMTWTVLLSIVLHGISSFPLAERYATWFDAHGAPEMAEGVKVQPMPTR